MLQNICQLRKDKHMECTKFYDCKDSKTGLLEIILMHLVCICSFLLLLILLLTQSYMLDHPITGVLNVLDILKNNWLKIYKFMSIQTQEDHIGHIKQQKSDRFQDHYFFLKQNMVAPIFSQKLKT